MNRVRGSHGEHIEGTGATAAPVKDNTTDMQGAISVTSPLPWMMDSTDGNKYNQVYTI